MSWASSDSELSTPHESVPLALGLSEAPTESTFFAAPSELIELGAAPALPAATTSTICWFPGVLGCASRTSASSSWAFATYAPPVFAPHEWFAMRAPSA
jgi:hypothetical protein